MDNFQAIHNLNTSIDATSIDATPKRVHYKQTAYNYVIGALLIILIALIIVLCKYSFDTNTPLTRKNITINDTATINNATISNDLTVNGQLDLSGPLYMAYTSGTNNVSLYDYGYLYLNTEIDISSPSDGISITANGAINCATIGLFGAGQVILASPSTGVFNVGGTIESDSQALTSDYRLKEEIEPISDCSIDKLKPCSYLLKDDESKKLQTGFIAHELQEIFPHLVNGEKDGERMQSVNYIGLIAILTKELQSLKSVVAELKADNIMLKAKLC